jgi:molybdate transport system permease protein
VTLLDSEQLHVVMLSVRVALLAVALGLLPGIAIAYGLARRRIPLAFVVENLVQIPLVLPPVVTGLLLLFALGPESSLGRVLEQNLGIRVAFSWVGAAVAAGVVSFPLLVQTMRVAFEQIDPALEEACYAYGGGRWDFFKYIVVPLSARGVAAAVILGFARALGEFGATIVLAGNIPGSTRTIPLAIFTAVNRVGQDDVALRLVVVAVLISILSLGAHALLTRRLHRAGESAE